MRFKEFLAESSKSLSDRISDAVSDIEYLRKRSDTIQLRNMRREAADIRLAVSVPRNSKARKSIYKAIRYLELRIAKLKKEHK